MHGARRVITFCILTTVIPTLLIVIPLYLRHNLYADVSYLVSESDILEIKDGISSVFCQKHILKMNSSFNAYQMGGGVAEFTATWKHTRLKKEVSLPDDTLEYWGFYLTAGSNVSVSACARYKNGRVLMVLGDRKLNTCGLLQHNITKTRAHYAKGSEHVNVSIARRKSVTPQEIFDKLEDLENVTRQKRQLMEGRFIEDGRIHHGGNGGNVSVVNSAEDSASSFENDLIECYDGKILMQHTLPNSESCLSPIVDESERLKIKHRIESSGYYYFIFYSDNDEHPNDVRATFDIYKTTYQYNSTNRVTSCLNVTECSLPIKFLTHKRVIVEVPAKHAIDANEDDVSLLTSVCYPRVAVYIFFPIAVLFFILICAFL